jgi:hypothetical protein
VRDKSLNFFKLMSTIMINIIVLYSNFITIQIQHANTNYQLDKMQKNADKTCAKKEMINLII